MIFSDKCFVFFVMQDFSVTFLYQPAFYTRFAVCGLHFTLTDFTTKSCTIQSIWTSIKRILVSNLQLHCYLAKVAQHAKGNLTCVLHSARGFPKPEILLYSFPLELILLHFDLSAILESTKCVLGDIGGNERKCQVA